MRGRGCPPSPDSAAPAAIRHVLQRETATAATAPSSPQLLAGRTTALATEQRDPASGCQNCTQDGSPLSRFPWQGQSRAQQAKEGTGRRSSPCTRAARLHAWGGHSATAAPHRPALPCITRAARLLCGGLLLHWGLEHPSQASSACTGARLAQAAVLQLPEPPPLPRLGWADLAALRLGLAETLLCFSETCGVRACKGPRLPQSHALVMTLH